MIDDRRQDSLDREWDAPDRREATRRANKRRLRAEAHREVTDTLIKCVLCGGEYGFHAYRCPSNVR